MLYDTQRVSATIIAKILCLQETREPLSLLLLLLLVGGVERGKRKAVGGKEIF